ncbi:MAG: hypothetical protein IT572_04325 [Deltaproteobacteria bacterium]|nr:hypothetical protein [Deltaproteobacteria bacterium]
MLEKEEALTFELLQTQNLRYDMDDKMKTALAKVGAVETFMTGFHIGRSDAEKLQSSSDYEKELDWMIQNFLVVTERRAKEAAGQAEQKVLTEWGMEQAELEAAAAQAKQAALQEEWDKSNAAIAQALGISDQELERLHYKYFVKQLQTSPKSLVFIDQDMNDWVREVFRSDGSLKGSQSVEPLKQHFLLPTLPTDPGTPVPGEKQGILEPGYRPVEPGDGFFMP